MHGLASPQTPASLARGDLAQAAAQVRPARRHALRPVCWRAPKRYVDDGLLEIDNNAAERALRGVALGKKTRCSPAPTTVVSALPPSTALSRLPSSAVSAPKLRCKTPSPALPTISLAASTTCFPGTTASPEQNRSPEAYLIAKAGLAMSMPGRPSGKTKAAERTVHCPWSVIGRILTSTRRPNAPTTSPTPATMQTDHKPL